MLRVGISLFLSGVFLGAGPCLIGCGPLLASFIAGNKKDIKQSIRIWLIFSLSRILAYLILGLLIGLLSQEVVYRYYDSGVAKHLFIIGGIFISLIGALMVLNRLSQFKICNILNDKLIKNDTKSVFIFGLVIGLLPCAPLSGILIYVALISKSIFKAIFYCFSFGLGTFASPLIIMAICASFIAKLLGGQEKAFNIFQKICGLIIIILGVQLILSGLSL